MYNTLCATGKFRNIRYCTKIVTNSGALMIRYFLPELLHPPLATGILHQDNWAHIRKQKYRDDI